MLLNSAILILREVLEAAILISVLLALSVNLRCRVRWFWWAAILGSFGTVVFASNLGVITDALDGAGQEVTNAALQGLVYCFTVVIVGYGALRVRTEAQLRTLGVIMTCAVACTTIREGSEIFVYITGFASSEEYRTAVFAGSAIGALIGLSSGILLYSALGALGERQATSASLVLLCLIGAGMIMQSTMLLEQVDWMPTGRQLWDSSEWVREQSITGELLYSVFGYESTPGAIQGALYLGSIFVIVGTYFLVRLRGGAVRAS